MKTCFKCNMPKPIEEFYKHPEMADGRLNKCKECTKRDVRVNYCAKQERYHEYERSPGRRASRRSRSLDGLHRQRQRYPEKYAARQAVSNALRDGRISKRPCVICGDSRAEAHHPDYSRPLHVVWLCRFHHRQVEGRIARGE